MSKLFNHLKRGSRALLAGALVSLALAGAAVGAPAASASPPDCSWQPLSLLNGWQSAQAQWGTGDPSYCVNSYGMVYLSGSLTQPGGGVNEVAVLPAQARPASVLYLSVYAMDGTTGVLQIGTDGAVYAYNGNSGGDVQAFTSLAGVSFPGTSVAQQPLSLIHGWQSAQSQWDTGDPSYSVTGDGVVHLSGSLNGSQVTPGLGVDTADEFAVLPQNARPYYCTSNEVYTYAGVAGTLGIEPTGMMRAYAMGLHVYNTPSAQYTSLAGVSYPPAGMTDWHAMGLFSPWSPGEGDCLTTNWNVDPSWQVIDGVVYLTGWMSSSVANNGELMVLPPAASPAHTLYLTLNEGPAPHASLEIRPDGAVFVFGAGNASGVDTLSGLSYQLSS